MRRIKQVLQISIGVVMVASFLAASVPKTGLVNAADAPSLVVSALKITSSNGQFVTLYNTADTDLDMSRYQLEYFNNYDPGKATSSRLIALSGTVPPHGYFMVNDDALVLCYQLTVDSVSLGFSSTSGFIEVVKNDQPNPGGPMNPMLQDYASWSKSSVVGIPTLPSSQDSFLLRQPTDATNNPSVDMPGAGSWKAVTPDEQNPCKLLAAGNVVEPGIGMNSLLPATEPPVTIIASGNSVDMPSLPSADIGLMVPVINELLPNPRGTGNDATDEFIELYNPNPRNFDLSGFALESGLTTLHHYDFPRGAKLAPHSFTAFYSSTTKLSLSNTSGQVKLLDPFGNSISASGSYKSAKDGVSWALAKGNWYWTTQPTPGKQNIIKEPPISSKRGRKKIARVKGSTLGNIKNASSFSNTGSPSDGSGGSPVHFGVLAIIGGLALLYGAYEYRADIVHYYHQLRRNLAARRRNRS